MKRMTRRQAIQTGTGAVVGAAAAFGGRTQLSAQGGAVNPTPAPVDGGMPGSTLPSDTTVPGGGMIISLPPEAAPLTTTPGGSP